MKIRSAAIVAALVISVYDSRASRHCFVHGFDNIQCRRNRTYNCNYSR